MKRFVQAQSRSQCTLFPESVDDFIAEDNPVRVIDVFVDELDLAALGFDGAEPENTGRPAYHPSTLLDENATESEYRDEPACAGLQHEARNADPRRVDADQGNRLVRFSGSPLGLPPVVQMPPAVFTQPRPEADTPSLELRRSPGA